MAMSHDITRQANSLDNKSASPLKSPAVTQDAKSWEAGYKAGHSGKQADTPPPGVDALAWSSGVIEGQADRRSGKVRPATRKMQP